jgi:phosphoribosylformylglycinamidine cyclo-ligase
MSKSAAKPGLTYAGSGVNYDALDPFKRAATAAAAATAKNIKRLGLAELPASRGESAYLIDAGDHYLAHVEEGLGTKNLVADATQQVTGKSYYDAIAQDTVACTVNDMITLGALPVSVSMHLGTPSGDWFADEARAQGLIAGWRRACDLARCVWGGGETPGLAGVLQPGTVFLSCSSLGIIKPKARLISSNIADGDAIVMFASSGIHANGVSLARKIAGAAGYDAKLSDGRLLGEALLAPTPIYVPVIEDIQEAGIDIHYAVNITGHGWRKLMRAVEPFVYTINNIPDPQPEFKFMQENGPVSDEEAYGNWNMGAGFAVYVKQADVDKIVQISHLHNILAWNAGKITKDGENKRVVIAPKNLTYEGSTLSVR